MLKLVSGCFGTSGIDALADAQLLCPMLRGGFGRVPRIDQDAIAYQILIVGSMQRLMEVGEETNQEREVAISSPPVVTSLFEASHTRQNLPVRQLSAGHRGGTSIRRSIGQMSMNCRGLVEGSSLRNFESGQMEAASIAAAILSVETPRTLATWLCAAGITWAAAITATISCPSSPHAHARVSAKPPKLCESALPPERCS